MRLSTRGRYGLRLMVELACREDKPLLGVEAMAKSQGISSKYIHVLMLPLKRAGLVQAVRGARGGYRLGRDPSSITAFDVVLALEGDLSPAKCLRMPGGCSRSTDCPTRELWRQVGTAVENVLKSVTLAELVSSSRKA